MRKLIFIFTLVIFVLNLSNAQLILSPSDLCVPDTAFANEDGNIYPEPFHERLNPKAGILDSACIGEDYSFVFTAVVPDSFPTPFGNLKLDWLKVENNGVIDIPKGLEYKCNPPSCDFVSGTLGCLEIFGKPSSVNELKRYDVKLLIKISVAEGFQVVSDTLPAYLSDSAHYYLPLFENGSINCQPTATYEVENSFFVELNPNPTSGFITFKIDLPNSGNIQYSISNIHGKEIMKKDKILTKNSNVFTEDLSMLKSGIYFIKTRYKKRFITNKIVIL